MNSMYSFKLGCFLRRSGHNRVTDNRFKQGLYLKSFSTLSRKIERSIFEVMENNGISNDSTIILNVSGGSDSMAMLHIMKEIQQQFMNQLDLKVINFNHKVRPESDEEVSVDLFFRETVLLTQSFVDSIY